ncbi:MAG: TatD family hydrolase [bacterium]|nr:TatD family hydrolase [bacterium]
MIDSHVHLDRHEFGGRGLEVAERARAAGVGGFLNVGYDLPSSRASVELAAAAPDIWATVGVHPHDALQLADAEGRLHAEGRALLEALATLAGNPRVVAIGEIGLDFFRDLSPRPAQRAALAAQLELAAAVGKPVVFHVRDAWAEIMPFVDTCGLPPRRGVLHAFSGDEAVVDWALARGLRLGIGGVVTYRQSRLPEMVARAGVEHLLLETDAPWLPPVPHRGECNEPARLGLVLDRVAGILQMNPGDVERWTDAGFTALFLDRGDASP